MKDITSDTIQEIVERFNALPEKIEWPLHPKIAAQPDAIIWLIDNNCLPRAYLQERTEK